MQKSVDFARRALEADGNDPSVLAYAAFSLAILGENIGAMIALVDRALALNDDHRLQKGVGEISLARALGIYLDSLRKAGPSKNDRDPPVAPRALSPSSP